MTDLSGDPEAARVRAVDRYRVVDVSPDAGFDRIAVLAAQFFDASIAAVSIVHRDRIWFAATYGLEDDVRQVARDDGLCGFVVQAGTPWTVSDALSDPRTAGRGFVDQHLIRFYAGAPIVTADGHRLGAVAVMDQQARTPSAKQLTLLYNLAAVVTEQLELRLSALDALDVEQQLRGIAEDDRDEARRGRDSAELDRDEARQDRAESQQNLDQAVRDRDIAEHERDLVEEYAAVLQRTLLPPQLPDIDRLELGAHYRAASTRQVGGDFYDVFPLGGSRWGFFLGDVLGHGPEAAAVTSLIRYTLRSAALHHRDLTRGLSELNAMLLREAEPRRFCTVVFGALEPHTSGDGFRVTIATGGHPPPLLIDPSDRSVIEVRGDITGMVVGAIPGAKFAACDVHLRQGQLLFCYTDGLVEARKMFDHNDLAEFAVEHARGGVHGLIDDIATLVPKLDPRDDIAVLAMQADARSSTSPKNPAASR